MRKKTVVLFTAVFMALSLVACGEGKTQEDDHQVAETKDEEIEEVNNALTSDSGNNDKQDGENEAVSSVEQITASSLEELNGLVEQDLDNRIVALSEEYEKIKTEIDTYEKYLVNMESIETFYENTYLQTRDICIRMREYCLDYARFIINMEGGRDEKYDSLEELYDIVYDEGGEKIYDEIYDGILDEIYDMFYDGILDEAYDTAEYEEWSDARSDEYEEWSDARGDVYEEWSDARSDIYEFWSDMRGEMWDADFEKAEEVIQEFQDDIIELKEEN